MSLSPALASTNANLFVSAENSQWNNYFAGPQVIQVVVADPDINRLDQAFGEPVVTVNGKKLRMAQNTDGNWYAYFADRNQAIAADSTAGFAGKGLDFGQFCDSGSAVTPTFSETKGFTVARAVAGSVDRPVNATAFGACTSLNTAGGSALEHVVRENKTLNGNTATSISGQIGIPDSNVWPIIQLYDFSAIPSTVTVDYQKSGGDQIVNLTFDKIPTNLITATPDRSSYPENSQVFITMTDPQLNIDPTEEDSWTWGANATNGSLYYQAFDRNGLQDADGNAAAMQNLGGNLDIFMFDLNGKLTIDPKSSGTRVIDFQSNGKQNLIRNDGAINARGDPAKFMTKGGSVGFNSEPITFIEQGGVNTGVFGNWDNAKKSNIITVDDMTIRGQSASITYNDVSQSIVGGFTFGTISMPVVNNSWASGQRIPVTLTDADENLNGKFTEHLNVYDPNVKRLVTMKIGTPFSLNSGGTENATYIDRVTLTQTYPSSNRTFVLIGATNHASNISQDEEFSSRPIFRGSNPVVLYNTGGLFVDLKTTMAKLKQTVYDANVGNPEGFKGFNFLNYDLRSIGSLGSNTGNGTVTSMHAFLVYSTNGGTNLNMGSTIVSGSNKVAAVSIVNSTNLQDFVNLNKTSSQVSDGTLFNQYLAGIPSDANIGLLFTFDMASNTMIILSTNGQPIVADFFSIGIKKDGISHDQKINNGIYRWELQETGDNTGVFTGSNQFVMLNQLNIFDTNTYSSLRTISHDVNFVAIENMLQSDTRAPHATYLDLGQDGVNTQISAQQDVSTHTGIILFDHSTYLPGDIAVITLQDLDLNVNNDLIDIYTAVSTMNDAASDTIGKTGLGMYSDGYPFGGLFQIKFDGIKWTNSGCFGVNSNTGTARGFATSLSATGFTLVETGPSTGIFTGNFNVPDQICYNPIAKISTLGTTITAEYVDFDDSDGNTKKLSTMSVVGATPEDHKYNILFKSGPFTPDPGINVQEITSGHQPSDLVHFLIQFNNIPTLSDKAVMLGRGITITDYVTGNTYIASSLVSELVNLNSLNNVRWAGAFKNEYKISYDLQNKLVPVWANYNGSEAVLTIQLQNGTDPALVEPYIKNDLKGIVIGKAPSVPSITAMLGLDKINDLASKDFVLSVDFVDPSLKTDDAMTRHVVGVDSVEQQGLDGNGVNILEYDLGQIYVTHHAISGRVFNDDPDSGETGMTTHATMVAGILIGNGMMPNSGPPEKGMAQGAMVFGYTNAPAPETSVSATGTHLTTIPMYNSSNDMIHDFTDAIANHAVNLTSMSLSSHIAEDLSGAHCDKQGDYSYTAEVIDRIVHGDTVQKKLMVFEAAGNDRDTNFFNSCLLSHGEYDTIDPPATAKNSIAVGAINSNDLTMSTLSSFGPTKDGRIKPDMVAPGDRNDSFHTGIISTSDGSDGYSEGRGTSFATPVISGSAALLLEKWLQIPGATTPLPNTVKAILVHTAKPPPQGSDGPDLRYGWGILNISDAVDLVSNRGSTGSIQVSSIVNTNDMIPFTFDSINSPDVKATLVWDDPSGQTNTLTDLNNKLDVKLKDPDGHVFDLSFICDDYLSCNSISHPQGLDDKNNVKMVVAHGVPGTWTANVTGTTVTEGPQNFTLIVTSYTPSSSLPPPTITSPNYGISLASNSVTVAGNANSSALIEVYVDGAFASTTHADPTTGGWSMTIQNLSQGTSRIYAMQRLSGDSSLFSNTVAVSFNNLNPPVITFPTSSSLLTTNQITVTGAATLTDPVVVFVNGSPKGSTSTFGPGGTWSLSVQLVGGSNTIFARQSPSGIPLDSATVTVTSPQQLTITFPTSSPPLTTNQITVTGTITPNSPVEVFVNNTSIGQAIVSGTTWSKSVTLVGGNSYTIRAQKYSIGTPQDMVTVSIVPEFPTALLILLSVFIAVVLITRTNFLNWYKLRT